MAKCSVEGCERTSEKRGWCGTHYARWRTNRDPLVTRDRPYKDLSGQRFHFLTVIETVGTRGNQRLWNCRCICGRAVVKMAQHLLRGDMKSCGCQRSRLTSEGQTTHNMSRTRVYRIWVKMISRCECPTNDAYALYGGRGISVAPEWRQSFEAFFADMGQPQAHEEIDRYPNNDGNYEPGNCRWATRTMQIRNRRNSVFVTRDGVTKPLAEWAAELGLPYRKAYERYRYYGKL